MGRIFEAGRFAHVFPIFAADAVEQDRHPGLGDGQEVAVAQAGALQCLHAVAADDVERDFEHGDLAETEIGLGDPALEAAAALGLQLDPVFPDDRDQQISRRPDSCASGRARNRRRRRNPQTDPRRPGLQRGNGRR